jgi:hypothetical protein
MSTSAEFARLREEAVRTRDEAHAAMMAHDAAKAKHEAAMDSLIAQFKVGMRVKQTGRGMLDTLVLASSPTSSRRSSGRARPSAASSSAATSPRPRNPTAGRPSASCHWRTEIMSRITKPQEVFQEFPKIPRLNREVIVTEKIDGTNASVFIAQKCLACGNDFNPQKEVAKGLSVGCCVEPTAGPMTVHAASRNKWIDESDDNHGFARWVADHAEELKALGPGYHRGEWHGPGINRAAYGLPKGEKRFYLFNTSRWTAATPPPACCGIVPILFRGNFDTAAINALVDDLRANGSRAYPGQKAEGIVIYHVAANLFFKVTCDRDSEPKGVGNAGNVK